jgi:hypothetical protein
MISTAVAALGNINLFIGLENESVIDHKPEINQLDWETCPTALNLECAKFEVPFDYRRRSKRTSDEKFTLSVIRLPASDESTKLGSIFINPGGPGMRQ